MLLHAWQESDLTYEPDYNVRGMRLPRLGDEPYEGGAWIVVSPGSTMTRHVNPPGESEVFFVLEGSGVMEVDGVQQRVGPGCCLLVPPGSPHSLRNDGAGPVRALALWWGAATTVDPES